MSASSKTRCSSAESASRTSTIPSRGDAYAQLAEKLTAMGIPETERNLDNKISRGGFTGAFLLQCLEAIGATELRLD
jgi:uncharacterized protein CbrC (UPF0167 family)